MKKFILVCTVLALCVALLGGCRLPLHTSLGVSSFAYENAERYAMGGAELTEAVERVEVDWVSGGVTVKSHGENTVAFSEEANRELNGDNTLYYWLDGTTLRIRFCRSGQWDWTGLEKDLTLWLPEELTLKELEIDSTSAPITVDAVGAEELTLESVSGAIRAADCKVSGSADLGSTSGKIEAVFTDALREAEVNTVSGKVEITAPEVSSFDADTTSGAVSLSVREAPKEIDVDTVSGAVTLCLPEDADFTLKFDSVSGSFSSELSCRTEGKKYICGNGTGDYEVSTTSGSVKILAAE